MRVCFVKRCRLRSPQVMKVINLISVLSVYVHYIHFAGAIDLNSLNENVTSSSVVLQNPISTRENAGISSKKRDVWRKLRSQLCCFCIFCAGSLKRCKECIWWHLSWRRPHMRKCYFATVLRCYGATVLRASSATQRRDGVAMWFFHIIKRR